jgi:hypothetical protein
MKNKDLYILRDNLFSFGKFKGAIFNHMRSMNLDLLDKEIEHLDNATPEIKTYREEYRVVYKKYAKRDEKGQILPNSKGIFQFEPKDEELMFDELKQIDEKYSGMLKERKEFLDLDSKIELLRINHLNLPDEMTGFEKDKIIELIK